MRRLFIIACVLLALQALPLGAQEQQADPEQSITLAELRDHMFFLASDALGGRLVSTEGYRTAAYYCASQFRAAGLETMVKNPDGNDSFLQHIPMVKRRMAEPPRLVVNTASGEQRFDHRQSFTLVLGSGFGELPPVVFAGYGIREPDHGWDDFDGLDIRGKTVILLHGAPVRDGEPVLPAELHDQYTSMESLQRKIQNVFMRGARALVFAADEQLWHMFASVSSVFCGPSYLLAGDEDQAPQGGFQPTIIVAAADVVDALFSGQAFNPADTESGELPDYDCFELEGARLTLEEVDGRILLEPFDSWNVVAMVRGTDPELADEYVTVGAHLDHVGVINGEVYNGADDNASGSIGVLEVAEAVAMAPPRRSVIFILYAAEDVDPGLTGSAYFVDHCPVPLESIVANVNLDMIGRTLEGREDTGAHEVLVPEGNSEGLWTLIEEVNSDTVGWPLIRLRRFEMGSSDHANFQRKGIAVACFSSGFHADVHQPTDDAERIEYDKMQAISQLVYGVVMELGNRD